MKVQFNVDTSKASDRAELLKMAVTIYKGDKKGPSLEARVTKIVNEILVNEK